MIDVLVLVLIHSGSTSQLMHVIVQGDAAHIGKLTGRSSVRSAIAHATTDRSHRPSRLEAAIRKMKVERQVNCVNG